MLSCQTHFSLKGKGNDVKAKTLTFEMVAMNRFTMRLNFYMSNNIVSIAKRYDGKFDTDKKEWVLHMKKYKECAEEIIAHLKPKDIKISVIPQFVFELLEYKIPFSNPAISNIIDYDYTLDERYRIDFENLSTKIKDSLYDFQIQGVKFGIKNYGRVLIGDEMGVGKTIQSLAIAYLYRKDWPLLVI